MHIVIRSSFNTSSQVFHAFKDGSIGNTSSKQIRKERKVMIENIRSELLIRREAEGLGNIMLSDFDIKKALNHKIVNIHITKALNKIKTKVFNVLKVLWKTSKTNRKKAMTVQFTKYVGKCFYAWSDYIYLVGVGLDRKRWPGPRKYEVGARMINT